MNHTEIKQILGLHAKWRLGKEGGQRADLSGADLRGAAGHFCFGPMPTSGRIVHCTWHGDSGWMVKAGCFWGNLKELEEKVKAYHNCPVYLGMIALLSTYYPAQ